MDGTRIRSISFPPNLWAVILSKFDDLASNEDLLYGPHTNEIIEEDGFRIVFQTVPHLAYKPIVLKDAPERRLNLPQNPFSDPDPAFVICPVGQNHTLMFNKYCVYRPSLLLITRQFAPQSDPLNASDLHAAWPLLEHFNEPLLMIYNCGAESGSSQGHKHMQIFPDPSLDIEFDLFPSKAQSEHEVSSNVPTVPIAHFALKLPRKASIADVIKAYEILMSLVLQIHEQMNDLDSQNAHNVILTKNWICLIPRRHSGMDQHAGANALSVLGVIWISDDVDRNAWNRPSPVDHLKYVGFATNSNTWVVTEKSSTKPQPN